MVLGVLPRDRTPLLFLILLLIPNASFAFQPYSSLLAPPRMIVTKQSNKVDPSQSTVRRSLSRHAGRRSESSRDGGVVFGVARGPNSHNHQNQHGDSLTMMRSTSSSSSSSETSPGGATDALDSLEEQPQQPQQPVQVALTIPDDDLVAQSLKFRWAANELVVSVVLGVLTGFSVAIFKLSIEAMRRGSYSLPFLANTPQLTALIPAFGGLLVGLLYFLGSMPPGLRGQVSQVEEESSGPAVSISDRLKIQIDSWRKSAGAVFTLGTGASLGPEGPCVEIGMGVARACMDINRQYQTQAKVTEWNRILLSCGAAAGVAAGFDAPVAGVFFGKCSGTVQ